MLVLAVVAWQDLWARSGQSSKFKGIYDLSWKGAMSSLPKDRCLSSGYSCRSQVKRMEK